MNTNSTNTPENLSAEEEEIQLLTEVLQEPEKIKPEERAGIISMLAGRVLELAKSLNPKGKANTTTNAAAAGDVAATANEHDVDAEGKAPGAADTTDEVEGGANESQTDAAEAQTDESSGEVIDGDDEDPLGTALDNVGALEDTAGAADEAGSDKDKESGTGVAVTKPIKKSVPVDERPALADSDEFDVTDLLNGMYDELRAARAERSQLLPILKSLVVGLQKIDTNQGRALQVQKSLVELCTDMAQTPASGPKEIKKAVEAQTRENVTVSNEDDPSAPRPMVVRTLSKALHGESQESAVASATQVTTRFGISEVEYRSELWEAMSTPELVEKYGLDKYEYQVNIRKSLADASPNYIKAVAESLGKLPNQEAVSQE